MIIGITGKKFHGKDTVADYLVEQYGYTKINFAQPLKDICKTLFSFSDEQLYGNLKEEIDPRWGISPRKAMQFVGTDLFRDQLGKIIPGLGSDIWLCHLKFLIEANPNTKYVIADLRFENEADLLIDIKAPILRVVRKNKEDNYDHISEAGISDTKISHELENSSSLQYLYSQIDEYMFLN